METGFRQFNGSQTQSSANSKLSAIYPREPLKFLGRMAQSRDVYSRICYLRLPIRVHICLRRPLLSLLLLAVLGALYLLVRRLVAHSPSPPAQLRCCLLSQFLRARLLA